MNLQLGQRVEANPKASKPISGIVFSLVNSLTMGRFVVVKDDDGRTHHCEHSEITTAEAV